MRLIDADALKQRLLKTYKAEELLNGLVHQSEDKARVSQALSSLGEAILAIDDAQAVDAVPVVRCKDCKWFINGHNEVDAWMTCTLLRHEVDKEWFCANGERKDDENKMD